MHDLRNMRRDLAAFESAMVRRGVSAAICREFDRLARAKHASESEAQRLNTRRNEIARAAAVARKEGLSMAELVAAGTENARELGPAERAARAAAEKLEQFVVQLPNIALPDVPDGTDERQNLVLHQSGLPTAPFWSRPHWEFSADLGLDSEAGVDLAGSRFAVLRGDIARLERALGQFMLDLHTAEHGYEETAVPHLVNPEALRGTGQLPKFEQDLFHLSSGHFLIPTAEVPLTNLVRGRVLDVRELPMRLTALTPCYRSEAGAAGRDTRGYMRQHQFHKVELVSVVTPETDAEEHERMTRCAETVLERLGLIYRRVLLCTGDMGFAAAKTFDLEVWMPGQRTWREISSVSTCGDFQARRMGTRLKGRKDLPHTLNGSGVALGRALVAVIETYREQDGTVRLPDVLRPYMGGVDRLRTRQQQRQT